MKAIPASQVKIMAEFWGKRLQINADVAIYHQWEQLEKTGCIENFRILADGVEGFREGYFFADSDAYKWLDAAARVYASFPSERLKSLMNDFINLIGRAQCHDGYIFTYNQLLFPDVRWINLQIEHELYCFGHLFEAGVSHFEATGEGSLLKIVVKAADLLVSVFGGAGPEKTPGHEEIELALIRLYRVTGKKQYLELAEHFIEQRGRIKGFFGQLRAQNRSVRSRGDSVRERQNAYVASHPEHTEKIQLPPDNISVKPSLGKTRWILNTATGKYYQQHKPVREQTVPVGHSVRFTYLETAIAMLYQEKPDEKLLKTLSKAWEHMVTHRMYVTGGIGSLPNIEGFGRDYELDPAFSYSETCAALGNMLWNWEMTLISGDAKYADLFEWQLYNAAAVGLGQDGASYLYNNPLSCMGGLTRAAWFKCPCCPSNVSRVWADLGKYVSSYEEDEIWLHQYVGCEFPLSTGSGRVKIESKLPWMGDVKVTLHPTQADEFTVNCRVPSWASGISVFVNGTSLELELPEFSTDTMTASGYDPRDSWYLPIRRTWQPGDLLEIKIEMAINLRATHHKVRSTLGQIALSYGPLVYCLESIDNPRVNIFDARLNPASLICEIDDNLFGGTAILRGQTVENKPLKFIPYYLWANRGESKMTVYVNV
jgi:DUF1680 family protein